MVTGHDKINFRNHMFDEYEMLSKSIEWISQNLGPEAVFEKDQLEEWAKDNGFVKES